MPDSALRYVPPRDLKRAGLIALAVAAAVVAAGLIGRVWTGHKTRVWTDQQAIPTVKVIDLVSPANSALTLPGDIQAFDDAPIHARVNGYLKKWYVDIGAQVRQGQILADIDTPDLDQQLAQARANLAVAVANQKLSQTTAARWTGLLARDAVSRQATDEKLGDLAAKTAAVNAAKALVDQLLAQESFKHLRAPFDGTVTSRSTDIGALITVGGVTDTPLFTVSDESRLRIYVRIPQDYTAEIQSGTMASFTVPEYPGRVFHAQLAASSQAISSASGAMLLQLQIDNRDHVLKPGAYAQVKFDLPKQPNVVELPASALTARHDGMAVAVVGPNDRVIIKSVSISRDMGAVVQIDSGVGPKERVIDNPPDSLETGDLVRVPGNGHAG